MKQSPFRDLPRRPRAAFTLLEVLIAAALSTVLLAAVLQSIGLLYQAEATRAERLQHIRTAVGILDAIERDVQTAIRRAEASGASDASDTMASADGSDAGGTAGTAVADLGLDDWRGLVAGEATILNVVAEPVMQPMRAEQVAATALDQGAMLVGGRRVLVTWSLDAEQPARTAATIATIEGEMITLQNDPLQDESLPAGTDGLGVTGLFRYYDGFDWLDAWDSVALGVNPVAIEATVNITDPEGGEAVTLLRVIPIASGRYAVPETAPLDLSGLGL